MQVWLSHDLKQTWNNFCSSKILSKDESRIAARKTYLREEIGFSAYSPKTPPHSEDPRCTLRLGSRLPGQFIIWNFFFWIAGHRWWWVGGLDPQSHPWCDFRLLLQRSEVPEEWAHLSWGAPSACWGAGKGIGSFVNNGDDTLRCLQGKGRSPEDHKIACKFKAELTNSPLSAINKVFPSTGTLFFSLYESPGKHEDWSQEKPLTALQGCTVWRYPPQALTGEMESASLHVFWGRRTDGKWKASVPGFMFLFPDDSARTASFRSDDALRTPELPQHQTSQQRRGTYWKEVAREP